MLPIITRGLGPSQRLIASGFGVPTVTTEESVSERFGGTRARMRPEKVEKQKRYEPGEVHYDVFTVGAVLVSVNNKRLSNSKMLTTTKPIYYEDISIQVFDLRKNSYNPFYKIFIECTGMKKRN